MSLTAAVINREENTEKKSLCTQLFQKSQRLNVIHNGEYYFHRVCASAHATVRGGVPSVCLPLDEQPLDEGAPAALHNQTVGHLPGTHAYNKTWLTIFFGFVKFYHSINEVRMSWMLFSLSHKKQRFHYLVICHKCKSKAFYSLKVICA